MHESLEPSLGSWVESEVLEFASTGLQSSQLPWAFAVRLCRDHNAQTKPLNTRKKVSECGAASKWHSWPCLSPTSVACTPRQKDTDVMCITALKSNSNKSFPGNCIPIVLSVMHSSGWCKEERDVCSLHMLVIMYLFYLGRLPR